MAIFAFTFFTAVDVSSARLLNAVVFTPAVEATFVIASVLIKAKSEASVKSNFLSASLAVVSLSFDAFVLTTSTTEVKAASNAASWEAPAPSAAPAKAFTTLMIC